MYNVQIASFAATFGVTFNAEAAGVRVEPAATIGGPDVIVRIVKNQAGALIDIDGTDTADMSPPQLTFSFRFVADNPAGHTQYNNLIAAKGRTGTFYGKIHGASGSTTYSAPARLIEVTGNARGWQRVGMQSVLVVTATWQLKDFLS